MATLTDDERFKLEYKKLDDDIRHYSTTRSALTSFLMTVGLTLLAYNFNNSYPNRPFFLWITGLLVLLAAIYVCLEFSRRTERSLIHQKGLWDWSKNMTPPYPTRSEILSKAGPGAVFSEMIKDLMNVGLIVVVIAIVITFFVCRCLFASSTASPPGSDKCAAKTWKCTNSPRGSSPSANSPAAAQAYALAVSSSADAAKAYAEAAAIARDAAKTYADSTKSGSGTCCCDITINCGESCSKRHSHGKQGHQ